MLAYVWLRDESSKCYINCTQEVMKCGNWHRTLQVVEDLISRGGGQIKVSQALRYCTVVASASGNGNTSSVLPYLRLRLQQPALLPTRVQHDTSIHSTAHDGKNNEQAQVGE